MKEIKDKIFRDIKDAREKLEFQKSQGGQYIGSSEIYPDKKVVEAAEALEHAEGTLHNFIELQNRNK